MQLLARFVRRQGSIPIVCGATLQNESRVALVPTGLAGLQTANCKLTV